MALWIIVMVVLTFMAPDRSVWTDVALGVGPLWVVGSTFVHEVERRRERAAATVA